VALECGLPGDEPNAGRPTPGGELHRAPTLAFLTKLGRSLHNPWRTVIGAWATTVPSPVWLPGRRGPCRGALPFASAALTCAAIAVALIAPAPAAAVFTRPFVRQLTEVPAGAPVPGPLDEPRGVAVNPASGDVLLTSAYPELTLAPLASPTIDRFDDGGSYVSQITGEGHFPGVLEGNGLAVDGSTGDLYVGGETVNGFQGGSVDVFDSSGTFFSEWVFPKDVSGLAVDNSTEAGDPTAGDVYIAQEGSIQLLSPSGAPVDFTGAASYIKGNELTGTPSGPFEFKEPWSIATDGHGNLYVVGREGHTLNEFNSKGVFMRTITGLGRGDLEAVAVDPTNGHILISESSGGHGLVDELGSSGQTLNLITGTSPSAQFGDTRGLAVDGEGDVYVADQRGNVVDEFGPGAFLPSLRIALAGETRPTSATVNGAVDPEGVPLTNCRFEYVTEATFEATGFADPSSVGEQSCEPAAGSIPVDTSYHAVSAELTGLQQGVTYRYRLAATSDPSQDGGTNDSGPASFTTPERPSVDGTSASNLSSSFVDLDAQINPRGADTTYQFQYVDAAGYEAALAAHATDPYAAGVSVPATPAEIGAGASDASVSQQVGGLQPGTTYHFRVVAVNEIGETDGPDETFTTLPAATQGLPDGRAYELLTPPNKGDGEDMFAAPQDKNFDVGYSSESGNQFLLLTASAFGPFPAAAGNAYVFNRSASGWTETSLASPSLGVQSLGMSLMNLSDLSEVGIHDNLGSASDEAALKEVNLVGPPGGPYTTISSTPYSGGANKIQAASADLSHVVLASNDHELAPGDEKQDPNSSTLYEWFAGRLSLVNVDGEGELLSKCGAVLGQQGGDAGITHGAVSADGSRIFFTAPDPRGTGPGCWEKGATHTPQLYVRENATTTVPISDPPGVKNPKPAVYVGASGDGSRVFFMTETKLTADDQTEDPELYEYDTNTGALVRVSRGESGEAVGNVNNVPAIAADGSAVYFTAFGKLTSNAPAPSADQADLYRFDTETEQTTYIATISAEDYPENTADRWWTMDHAKELGLDAKANWYTTPDGRYLVFGSTADITGYDNRAASPEECPSLNGAASGTCIEIYRYDSVEKTLTCVSCDPDGARPTSNAEFARSGRPVESGEPPRPISNDGSYVFFDTGDALVPQDTNGKLDVYEWHEGTVSLISSGTDSSDSFFLDSSPDGANVFFGTHSQLVPADTDDEGDLYDARICTASEPCIQPTAGETAQCEGDACQNALAPPIEQTPASLAFSGAGNVLPALTTTATVTPKAKPPLTRAQKLAAALKACRRKSRKARPGCEAQARRRDGDSAKKRAGAGVKSSGRSR
jgi:hypothetical protein